MVLLMDEAQIFAPENGGGNIKFGMATPAVSFVL